MGNCLHQKVPRSSRSNSSFNSSELQDIELNDMFNRLRRDSFGEFNPDSQPRPHADTQNSVSDNNHDSSSISSHYSVEGLIRFIDIVEPLADADSESENDENVDDLEISFEDDISDTGDKRVYFDENSCEICVSEYDEDVHKPIILPCGHVLCLHCVRKIFKRNKLQYVECPLDRKTHLVKNRQLDEASLNTALISENVSDYTVSLPFTDDESDMVPPPFAMDENNYSDRYSGSIRLEEAFNLDPIPQDIPSDIIGTSNENMIENSGSLNTRPNLEKMPQACGPRMYRIAPNEMLITTRPFPPFPPRNVEEDLNNYHEMSDEQYLQDSAIVSGSVPCAPPRPHPNSNIQQHVLHDRMPIVRNAENPGDIDDEQSSIINGSEEDNTHINIENRYEDTEVAMAIPSNQHLRQDRARSGNPRRLPRTELSEPRFNYGIRRSRDLFTSHNDYNNRDTQNEAGYYIYTGNQLRSMGYHPINMNEKTSELHQ
ncbi:hypothetical protein ACF0H5_020468 [Mactra antiquata]